MLQILVVDDSKTIRREIAAAMGAAGFAVVEAEDGLAGLDKARQQNFAMIILDVNMPRMNGLEMLETLHDDPRFVQPPVLFLTTEADRTLMERARKAGAKGWMIKPVGMDHLVNTVKALTSR